MNRRKFATGFLGCLVVSVTALIACGTDITQPPAAAIADTRGDAEAANDSGDDDTSSSSDGAPAIDPNAPLPYPTRTAYRIKAIQPDFWPDMNELVGNNVGGVAMNLVWAGWENAKKAPPCDASTEDEYDGRCFTVDANVDKAITNWTAKGVVVTAVVYGVPAWARTKRPCSPVAAGFDIFCVPDDAADYGRFAGLIARRYDGKHGHGRAADFVIHNEVNANDWFDIGCGQGTACDQATWIATYADNYNAAYDRIVAEQSTAKVLVSLEHHFLGPSFDDVAASNPLLSGTTFLTGFAKHAAPRAWRLAYHPYPPNLLAPGFSADDAPLVTYGNIGTVVGWLRQTFPDVPSSWDVQLTESGVNSIAPGSSQAAQASGVCDSLRNVLGTPGISNYVYHRMKDHSVETASGLGLGLREENGNAKQAWAVWALANRNDLTPPQLSCGFEDVPYTRLKRSVKAGRGHWASTRIAPAGFTLEQSWRLLRDEALGTVLLYECRVGQHNLLTRAANCEALEPLGPVGYAYTTNVAGTVPLYRCTSGAGADHFVSHELGCESETSEGLLGYVLP